MPFSTTSKRSSSTDTNANGKKNAKNARDATADDTSSTPNNTPRPFSPVTNQAYHSKDTRAYEYARQKSKHAQDFAKKRAKKEEKAERKAAAAAIAKAQSQSKVLPGSGGKAASAAGAAAGGHGSGPGRSWGGGAAKLVSADVEVDEEEILMAPVERSGGRGMSTVATVTAVALGESKKVVSWFPDVATPAPAQKQEGGGIRVNLADLIIVSERKPKRIGGGGHGADDFEVVPHVKAVIALDDMDDFEMELDEPWEHIQADEDKVRGPRARKDDEPSYASVLAGLATPTALD